MLYRQHSQNVVGAYTYGIKYRIKMRMSKVFDKKKRNGRSRLGAELLRCFPEITGGLPIYEACYNHRKISNKLLLLRNVSVLRKYTSESRLGLSLKILFNLF